MANKRNQQIKPSKFRRILNSSITNVCVPILSLYNLVLSYYVYYNETAVIKEAINDNPDLTDRLLKLNAFIPRFSSVIKFSVSYAQTDEPVSLLKENVRRNLITMLDNLVVSNDLLGVLVIKIRSNYKTQAFDVRLQPANLSLVKLNLRDFSLSILMYAVLIALYALIF